MFAIAGIFNSGFLLSACSTFFLIFIPTSSGPRGFFQFVEGVRDNTQAISQRQVLSFKFRNRIGKQCSIGGYVQ